MVADPTVHGVEGWSDRRCLHAHGLVTVGLGICHPAAFGFVFNDTATTDIYTLSLHDALPIFDDRIDQRAVDGAETVIVPLVGAEDAEHRSEEHTSELQSHVNLVCRLLLE